MSESDLYEGRMETDGEGNLLASEGDKAGQPIAYHEGSYVFLSPGEPSHNERHSQNEVELVATQSEDPDLPGYVDPEDPGENAHHFGVLEDDPHYEKVKFDPDAVAAKISGHTSQGGE